MPGWLVRAADRGLGSVHRQGPRPDRRAGRSQRGSEGDPERPRAPGPCCRTDRHDVRSPRSQNSITSRRWARSRRSRTSPTSRSERRRLRSTGASRELRRIHLPDGDAHSVNRDRHVRQRLGKAAKAAFVAQQAAALAQVGVDTAAAIVKDIAIFGPHPHPQASQPSRRPASSARRPPPRSWARPSGRSAPERAHVRLGNRGAFRLHPVSDPHADGPGGHRRGPRASSGEA